MAFTSSLARSVMSPQAGKIGQCKANMNVFDLI